MPSKIHYAMSRQWELLKLLPAHGAGKSSAALASQLSELGFQVTKRTVERDLQELLTIFPIECNQISIPYGWRWLPDSGLSLPGISLAEALSLQLVEDFLRPLLPLSLRRSLQPRFQLASGKMTGHEGNQVKTWPDKVRVIPPQIDQQVLATV